MATQNVQSVTLGDGREVCLSYGVIVAAFIPSSLNGSELAQRVDYHGPWGYVKTAEKFSVTSSKHATQFAGREAATIGHGTLKALCEPVASRY